LEDGSSVRHRVNEKQLSQVKWVIWYYRVSVIPGNVFVFISDIKHTGGGTVTKISTCFMPISLKQFVMKN